MKILTASICALLLLAVPAVTWAQYSERWSTPGLLSPGTSLIPGNVGNVDADAQMEVVISGPGSPRRVQVRDAITGAVEFESSTNTGDSWTIYLVNLDADAANEILASDGFQVIVIDYAGALAAPSDGNRGTLQELHPAQPNPFESYTSLNYTLATPGTAEIEIFDVAGRMVRRLGGERRTVGEHHVKWDGRDQSGRALQAGMYLYRLSVDGHAIEARKTIRLGS